MNAKSFIAAGIIASMLALSASALAQSAAATGEVRKVDAAAGKITLHHGSMKQLGMEDPMTMVYRVPDSAMLKQLKAGDKVKFVAERVNGVLTIIKIEKTK